MSPKRVDVPSHRMLSWIATGLTLILLCTAAAQVHTVERMVIGGGHPVVAGDLRLYMTVGEGIAGPADPTGRLHLTSGFWAGIPQPFDLYLPVVEGE